MTTRESLAEVRRRGEVAVIDLAGVIDRSAEAALEAAFTSAAAGEPSAVVLNFAQAQYINSTGIALIVGVLARARAAGLAVRACGLSDHYREIFEITRLADFMQLYPDEESAVTGASASDGGR